MPNGLGRKSVSSNQIISVARRVVGGKSSRWSWTTPTHLESLDRDLGVVTSFPECVWALDKDLERHDWLVSCGSWSLHW